MKIDPALMGQLVLAFIGVLTALAAYLQSLANSRNLKKNTDMTADIHKATNGEMSQAVSAAQTSAAAATLAAATVTANTPITQPEKDK